MLEAVRSLKCIEAGIADKPEFASACINGVLNKTGMDKRRFDAFCYKNNEQLEDGSLNFNIENLSRQITAECIYDTDNRNSSLYGGRNENDVGNCVSLITRIDGVRKTGILNSMFGFGGIPTDSENLINTIDAFLNVSQNDKFLLRIGFEDIGFESQAREITANAIGKYLLNRARGSLFKTHPLVLFLDEAHQFLNKNVVDEYFSSVSLSSFDQIAKECR